MTICITYIYIIYIIIHILYIERSKSPVPPWCIIASYCNIGPFKSHVQAILSTFFRPRAWKGMQISQECLGSLEKSGTALKKTMFSQFWSGFSNHMNEQHASHQSTNHLQSFHVWAMNKIDAYSCTVKIKPRPNIWLIQKVCCACAINSAASLASTPSMSQRTKNIKQSALNHLFQNVTEQINQIAVHGILFNVSHTYTHKTHMGEPNK